MPARDNNAGRLYVVLFEPGREIAREDFAELGDACALGDGHFLICSALSQSTLYHAVKRRTQPARLFVAALDGAPVNIGDKTSHIVGGRTGHLRMIREGPRSGPFSYLVMILDHRFRFDRLCARR